MQRLSGHIDGRSESGPAESTYLQKNIKLPDTKVPEVHPHLTESDQVIPLSIAQQRVWLAQRAKKALACGVALRLKGGISRRVLQSALDHIVMRHDALRTTFRGGDSEPLQVIRPMGGPFVMEESEAATGNTLDELCNEERRKPFDLHDGPLVRGKLIRVSEQEHLLVITSHPISADRESLRVIARELESIYNAYIQGEQESPRPQVPQYADYSAQQRVDGEKTRSNLKFWIQTLSGAPASVELPTAQPRSGLRPDLMDHMPLRLSAQLTDRLQALSQRFGGSLLTTLLGALALVLGRWAGQDEVVIGTSTEEREPPEFAGAIGCFENPLPLRVRIDDDPTVARFLERLGTLASEAKTHRHVRFDQLVRALGVAPDTARHPIFQVYIELTNSPRDTSSVENSPTRAFQLEELLIGHPITRLDLSLLLRTEVAGLIGVLTYPQGLFDKGSMERFASQWQIVLEGMASEPWQTVSRLSLMVANQRNEVLYGFNATKARYPEEKLIHELFEEQAKGTPDAVALVYNGDSLTYGELDSRANHLARYLRSRGVGPEQLVGVCVNRSLEMVVGLLGILKAGGAYVPFDASYPAERLQYMVSDAAPRMVLTQKCLRGRLPQTATEILELDEEWQQITQLSLNKGEGERIALRPNNLAYVIYTSGSTGRPKGAMNEHRGVVNRLIWMQSQYGLGQEDRVLQKTPFSFDVSVWEFFWTLMSGARLIMARPEGHKDPAYLRALIEETGITTIHFVPSMLQSFLDNFRPGACPSLRHIVCSGEELSASLQQKCFECLPHVRLSNMYGPTEAAVDVTAWECVKGDTSPRVPIGHPIWNTQMYIVDRHGQPVPIGFGGEILIGGRGVGRGYVNRPELTAERFLKDPFNADPLARIYRTGDLGRWRPDGSIEYLGRNDHQVKIRGFRIELGEIEARLLEHPHVKEAVVVSSADDRGEQRLLGYVVVDLARLKALQQLNSGELGVEIVDQWKTVFEETYSDGAVGPTFAGWNSTYTGRAIPEEQMREWVNRTVERISALKPHRVLEVGCGVGLLMERLAPSCEVYRGIDISAVAIERLRRWAAATPTVKHVELQQCSALQISEVPSEGYDVVVLNSVVQLFPDANYLREVLKRAVSWTSPGGRIFVGDVRPLSLLKVFQSAVQLSRAAGDMNVVRLKGVIAHALEREKDLLIDPEFFQQIPEEFPGIGGVRVLLRRGEAVNELTRYRYDVVLTVGAEPVPYVPVRLNWSEVRDFAAVVAEIVERRPPAVLISGIPNRRLCCDVAADRVIEAAEGSTSVETLRQIVSNVKDAGEDPEYLWALGESHGIEVCIGWHLGGREGEFDMEWINPSIAQGQFVAEESKYRRDKPSPARRYERVSTNDPWGRSLQRQLIPRLRRFLAEKLPAFMMPAIIVALDGLPLTANGKLDRRSLPLPAPEAYPRPNYEVPQGEVEIALTGIWEELLRVERIGRQDNFFELGGHSLLIVEMTERLRQIGLSTEVQSVFESPTLAALASTLEAGIAAPVMVLPALIPLNCEVITPQMLPLVELEPEHIEWIVNTTTGGSKNIEDVYPLVPLQEGMLFHHAFNQGGDTYISKTLFEVRSREALEAFIRALQIVVDRHSALRTAILWEGLPKPVQVVWRRAVLPVEEVKLVGIDDPVDQLRERMRSVHRKWDVRQAPLMRLEVVVQPRSSQCYAVLHLHHLVSDRISLEIMMSEVMAYFQGRLGDLPRPVPYRSHVAQTLSHGKQPAAEAFFRSRLGRIAEPIAPFGLTDVRGDGSQSVEASQRLDEALVWRVRSEARRMKVSVATLFHASWGLVVSQSSGQAEIVFGTVLSGRIQSGAIGRDSVGMFINTLPLRLQLQGSTVADLVRQAQLDLMELMKFEQISLTTALQCSLISGAAPLFCSLLTYTQSSTNAGSGWTSSESEICMVAREWRTNYPIALLVDDNGGEILVTTQTDRRVDPRRLMAYLSTALQAMVEALEKAPNTAALALSILPDSEQRQVLNSFGAPRTAVGEGKLIHERFEEQVERSPDVVAVVYEERSLTYGELNERANRLAHSLREYGVSCDQRVGICVERGLEMVIGILGVWKAGGAYVPLDPNYPDERLQYMMSDSAPTVVLTQAALRVRLSGAAAAVIVLDEKVLDIEQYSSRNPDGRSFGMRPSNLAYVIYTSGSTGRPKGVMVEHRSVVSHGRAIEGLYREPYNCQRVGVNAPFTFDASVQQFVQLLSGRTLFLVPQSLRLDAAAFLDFMKRNRIEGIDCTPSQLNSWVLEGLLEKSGMSLRTVLVGGEAITKDLWNLLAQSADITFYNVYGPTECTVDATSARIKELPEVACIGRPLTNTQSYLLDCYGRVVPIGVAGEIYIGGSGVARGYLNRPALTAERFQANQFEARKSERLYRTGDLGRWRADGTIEYLGRNDDQVKIRGHRIELGEIKAQLSSHEQVKESVVVVQEGVPGEKRLVAYATDRNLKNRPALTKEVLRAHLKSRLPAYMVPGAIVILTHFPLTSGGKLDRRTLPVPESESTVALRYEAPQGETEEVLAGIWQRLLQVHRVGRWDDFFELGGHSILATRLVFHIRQELGLEFPLEVLFSNPTIASIADVLSRPQSRGDISGRIPLKASSTGGYVVCFPPTSLGLGTRFKGLAECLDAGAMAYTCRLPGLLPDEKPLETIQEIASHCIEQLNPAVGGKEWSLVGWSFSGFVAYEIALQMARAGLNIRRLVLLDTYVPPLHALRDVCDDDRALREAFSRTMGAAGMDTTYQWESVVQMFRQNLMALEAYLRQPVAYRGSVVEIRAEQSIGELRFDAQEARVLPMVPERVIVIPGDHYSIMNETNDKRLGIALREALR